MDSFPEASAILYSHGIAIVPANQAPGAGETRAVGTLQQIVDEHGRDHADFVVMTLAEAGNGRACINRSMLLAVSDLVRIAESLYPEIMKNDVEKWFKFFDEIPLGWIQVYARAMGGFMPKRYALGGMIGERLQRAWKDQPDLLDDRRRLS